MMTAQETATSFAEEAPPLPGRLLALASIALGLIGLIALPVLFGPASLLLAAAAGRRKQRYALAGAIFGLLATVSPFLLSALHSG